MQGGCENSCGGVHSDNLNWVVEKPTSTILDFMANSKMLVREKTHDSLANLA